MPPHFKVTPTKHHVLCISSRCSAHGGPSLPQHLRHLLRVHPLLAKALHAVQRVVHASCFPNARPRVGDAFPAGAFPPGFAFALLPRVERAGDAASDIGLR